MANTPSRVSWIDHNGKRVLYCDYNHLPPEYGEKALEEFRVFIEDEQPRDVLLLLEVTGSYVNTKMTEEMRSSIRTDEDRYKKTALVGVVGLQKYVLRMINSFRKLPANAFDTVEEALEWLTADD